MNPRGKYIADACRNHLIGMGFSADDKEQFRRHLNGKWDLLVYPNVLPRNSEVLPFSKLYSLEIEEFCQKNGLDERLDPVFLNRPARMIDPSYQGLKFNRDMGAALDQIDNFIETRATPYFMERASWDWVLDEDLSTKNRHHFNLIRQYALMCLARDMSPQLAHYFERVETFWNSVRGTVKDRWNMAEKSLLTLAEVRDELGGLD